DQVGDAQEDVLRAAGRALDHLGRVAREVAADDLEHAARVGERLVATRGPLVGPRRRVVLLLRARGAVLRVLEAREDAVEVLGVAELGRYDRHGLRVARLLLAEPA